jgi:hypothetical protein
MENRTARLTILIDPCKKQIFEEICAAHDLTPSQVVRDAGARRLILAPAGAARRGQPAARRRSAHVSPATGAGAQRFCLPASRDRADAGKSRC